MKKSHFFLLWSNWSLQLILGASEIDPSTLSGNPLSVEVSVFVTKEYLRGRYLIYDCQEQHYICVDHDGYDLCNDKRQQSQQQNSEVLACAPLKMYDSLLACSEGQYDQIHFPASKRFCLNDKIIDYWQLTVDPTEIDQQK